MYPEEICKPMREDLTSVGFIEMKTPEEVANILDKNDGTVLVMVNSVCGCAAGNARPAVKMSTNCSKKPNVFATCFFIISSWCVSFNGLYYSWYKPGTVVIKL